MKITLVPRAAPSDRLRVWIGVQAQQQPALTWRLDGQALPAARVRPLRDISSVIPQPLLGGQPARNFAGVFELSGLAAGTAYVVAVDANDGASSERAELRTRTLPAEVPGMLDRPFNVLLVSCFHQAEDRSGHAGIVAGQLTGPARPDLTLLLGDQVYLDLPTIADFPDDSAGLAAKFESDYRTNWQGEAGYTRILTLAPSASLPDDHEYWNNFPHRSPIIQNSWKEGGRENWTTAAAALYGAFQFDYEPRTYLHHDAEQPGDARVIDVEPLSFFLADSRSGRDYDRASVLTRRGFEQLEHWVQETTTKRRVGIFITGQSMLDARAGWWEGTVADYLMPNYDDFGNITGQLGRIAEAGLPMVLITGDVHWGRVTEARDVRSGRRSIFEIISSPTSLVSTVGSDQLTSIWTKVKPDADPWPRHSNPAQVPKFLWSDGLGKRFACAQVHPQRGNHVALLSFTRSGAGVRLRTTYYPIHEDLAQRTPVGLPEISLTPELA